MDHNGSYSFDQNSLPQDTATDFSAFDSVSGEFDPLPGHQQSTLQQHAGTVPGGNAGNDMPFQELPDGPLDPLFGFPSYLSSNSSTLQQPANNAFANGVGLGSVRLGSLNQASESFNGPFHGLNDYQSFNQTPSTGASVTNEFYSEFFDTSTLAFDAPYSFNQGTLPQNPAADMFAQNAPSSTPGFYSVDQNAFDGALFAAGSVTNAPLQFSEVEVGIWLHTLEACPTSSVMLSGAPALHHAARPSTFSCDWPACNSTEAFSDQITHSQHVSTVHVQKVLQDGSDGTCKWPGCTKTNLDTIKKLELHITNIHIEPLTCTITPCTRAEPFERKGDLDRHIFSVHERGRTWKCPQKDCSRHAKGFPRKDKLRSHIRARSHGTYFCQYTHCRFQNKSPFMTQAELTSHYDDHGSLECGIGSCKDKISAFSLATLSHHLCLDHSWRSKENHTYQLASLDLVTESVKKIVESSQGATLRVFDSDLEGLTSQLVRCWTCS